LLLYDKNKNFCWLWQLERSANFFSELWVGSAKRTLPAPTKSGLASKLSVRIFFKIGSDFVQRSEHYTKTAYLGGHYTKTAYLGGFGIVLQIENCFKPLILFYQI